MCCCHFTSTCVSFSSQRRKFSVAFLFRSLALSLIHTHTAGLLLSDRQQGTSLTMKYCCPIRALIKIWVCIMSFSEGSRTTWSTSSHQWACKGCCLNLFNTGSCITYYIILHFIRPKWERHQTPTWFRFTLCLSCSNSAGLNITTNCEEEQL